MPKISAPGATPTRCRQAMREFQDSHGRAWHALAVPGMAAHGRQGAILGFRPAGEPDAEPLLSDVDFNSDEAAEFALSTMSTKELLRRLNLARATVGRV